MEELSIINTENTKQISEKLRSLADDNTSEAISVYEDSAQPMLLKIPIKSHETKPIVSDIISAAIQNCFEEQMIQKIINNYQYFSHSEKNEIYKNVVNANYHLLSYYRRELIKHSLNNYLANNNKIILEGFINFRLKEYKNELATIAKKAANDFAIEKEYKEFINLLTCFVEIQPPKENVVHVVVDNQGHHEIYNENKENITNKCRAEFISVDSIGIINYDDLLMSALITLSPHTLYFHGFDNLRNKELAITIQNVFLKRLVICNGCAFCKKDL